MARTSISTSSHGSSRTAARQVEPRRRAGSSFKESTARRSRPSSRGWATPWGSSEMNLRKHELIGLRVEIVRSEDPGLLGVAGVVVDETRNTLLIDAAGRGKRAPTQGSRFRFDVPGGAHGDGDDVR